MTEKNKRLAVIGGILLASLLFSITLLITHAFAAEDFVVFSDRGVYFVNQDVFLVVSGSGGMGFVVQVFDEDGVLVFEGAAKTSSLGNGYVRCGGFSSVGVYEVRVLVDGNVRAIGSFRVVEPLVASSVSGVSSTVTVTTSFVYPTTPTSSTVVTTEGEVWGSSPAGTASPSNTHASSQPTLFRVRPLKPGFRLDEDPEFEIEVDELKMMSGRFSGILPEVILKDDGGEIVNLKPQIVSENNKYKIKFLRKRSTQPGAYSLSVELDDEREEIQFTWGLVSVNTKKSMYHPGDLAEIIIVVLDDRGYPVSGANVQLKVKSPLGVIEYFSTSDGSIAETSKGVYLAKYSSTWSEGVYNISVVAEASGFSSSVESYFVVKEFFDFDIIREVPATIDPQRDMLHSSIRVVSYVNDTEFTLREYLPKEFIVVDSGGAEVRILEEEQVLSWRLSNNSIASYSAQLPLRWPYLYVLGPAQVSYYDGLFSEARPWYLAVDPSIKVSLMLFWNDTSIPDGWTCLSCDPSGVFYHRFPRGSGSYGSTGGLDNHTHTINLVSVSEGESTGIRGTGATAAISTHTHTMSSPSVSTKSNLPRYRNLKVIAYNNGIPLKVPAGAIAVFNTSSLPSGWSRYSQQDGYFVRGGEDSSSGGSNNHTHSVSYTLAATSNTVAVQSQATVIALASHTHTVSGTSALVDHQPPYMNVVFGRANSETYLPAGDSGMIAMFNSTPPANWLTLSGSGGAFSGRFIAGSNVYGSTGGSRNHSHSNLVSTSSSPNNTRYGRAGTTAYAASSTHNHLATASFSTVEHLPPYIDVIFAMLKVKVFLDKAAYYSSERVRIYSYGWGSDSTVTLDIRGPSGSSVLGYPKNVSANATGWLTDSWIIPSRQLGGLYNVSARSVSNPILLDYVLFNVTSLWVNLTSPASDPRIDEGESFIMSCAVNCFGSTCQNVNVYGTYCSGSLYCVPNTKLTTTSTGLKSNSSGVNLGSLTNQVKTVSFNITGVAAGDYVIACNVTSSNTGNSSSLPENTSLHVNDPPVAVWDNPLVAGKYVQRTIILNASSSSDSDGTISYIEFWDDSDSSYGSLNLLCNDTSPVGWTCSWNTSADGECFGDVACYLRIVAVDDDGAKNSSDTNVIIDNTPPTVSNETINVTSFGINEWICLNASVSDNYAVDSVSAEINVLEIGDFNITLLDDGLGCDSLGGDGVYSATYQSTQSGTYNWTKTYANDSAGNRKIKSTGLTWNVSTNATMSVTMVAPSSNLRINESGQNSRYQQTCNVSCDSGGVDCQNVVIYAQYDSGGWTDITTSTTDLVNEEDSFSCGLLIAGGLPCSHTFNISAGSESGGKSWLIRCEAEASNAPNVFSANVNLSINDVPTAAWIYPSYDGEWLHSLVTLNASASSDSDGLIVNYLFELDNSTTFSSSDVLCSSSNKSCSFNTGSQSQCRENDSLNCFLRLTVRDNDGAENSSIRRIGVDNSGPSSVLNQPQNNGYINSNSFMVNASVSDSGIGKIFSVIFEYRQNNTAAWLTACIDSDGSEPFSCLWDISALPDKPTYEVRVRANDSLGNLGGYSTHTGITVDRVRPRIILNSPTNDSNHSSSSVTFNFTASDGLATYLSCSLYLDSLENETNESTWNNMSTTFTVIGISEGPHSWYVNCSDPSGNWNISETRSFTVDYTAPSWSQQSQRVGGSSVSLIHRGDSVDLSAYWTDNIKLSKAILSTNETGFWVNKSVYGSPLSLSGVGMWSNFSWSNSSLAVGTLVGWRIYANDSAGNFNKTDIMSFRVWGWSKIAESNLDPSSISVGDYTTMSCRVVDNLTGGAIQNYPVRFYNSTSLLGTNATNSDGWAYYRFRDNSAGTETINCTITDNISLYYNDTVNNFAQKTLSTEAAGSPIIYRIISDPCERGTYCRAAILVYNPNPTTIRVTAVRDTWSTDRISSIRQCCTPDGCNLAYCTENPAGTIRFNNQSAWVIGARSYLLFWYEILNTNAASSNTLTANVTTVEYGSKTRARAGVDIINSAACAWTAWNDTTGFDVEASTPDKVESDISTKKNYTLRLREFCNVQSLGTNNRVRVSIPSGWTIGTMDSRCSNSGNTITCNLTSNLLNSYTDFRIELTSPNVARKDVFVTNVTGNDVGGIAHQDVNEHVVITRDMSAPKWSQQSQKVGGNLVSLIHWGESIKLSSYWTDNLQLNYAILSTNETGFWVNKSVYGSPLSLSGVGMWSNFSWSNSSLAVGTLVGWRIYANDSAGNFNKTDIMSFRVWGWSKIAWITPLGGNYSGNANVKLVCRVTDANTSAGIGNYPVKFYRGSTFLGTNKTNSSGYAIYTWNTGSLASGNYPLSCNITDNSSLYYNDTAQNSGSTTVTVDGIPPQVMPLNLLSGSYTADTTLNFSFRARDDFASTMGCSLYVDSYLMDSNNSVKNNTPTKLTASGLTLGPHRWNISCADSVNTNWSETRDFTVYVGRQLNLTVINSSGAPFTNTRLTILDKLGQTISSKNITAGDSMLSDTLALNQLYDVETVTPLPEGSLKSIIRNLNVSGNLVINPQVVAKYSGKMPPVDNVTSLYALNDTGLSYSLAELYIPKNSLETSNIVHCISWSFLTANCSMWEVNASENYNMQENSTHIWFNVTDFTAFGGGKGKPLPNVTQIRVYDVTGQGDTHTGGTLVGSGLNSTFNFYLRQKKTYRVEIDVRNDASTQWTIESADVVYHSGLNSTWQINPTADIWYKISGIDYVGGTWSSGKVQWNTSKGGKLTNKQTMTFYYVFNMTTYKTEKYQVYFLCNDTSTNSGSFDYSAYNITRVGYLEVNLTVPPQIPGKGDAETNGGYLLGRFKLFTINATVYCRDGFCGNVNGTLRYNASSASPDTKVSTTSGSTPFYIVAGSNPRTCSGNPLVKDEFCQLSWTVNSTGNLASLWKMDVLFASPISASNNTNYIVIDINLVLILSLSWSETDFGVCDPVTFGNPALLNAQKGYNITLDENSNDADGLYIRGTDLDPRYIPSLQGVSYKIGVGNLSWNAVENNYTGANTTRLSYNYVLIKSPLPSGSVVTTYYWIDIPRGEYAQPYDGAIYVLVNKTEEY